MNFPNIGEAIDLTTKGEGMCYSNCPYEYWSGECKISHRPYPANAHCNCSNEFEPLKEDEEYEDEDDLLC